MGKTYTQPGPGDPRWLAFLKPVLSGIYTADNLDYVLRDAHMCGVAVGADLDRIIYYSFTGGLTLDRSGTQALIMFLTARFYMYTNVYYHRTTRAIDLHLKEIFRPTMRIVFPWDLRKDLHPYLHLTEWTLLEEVGRWHEAEDPERRALGREWRQVLDRRIRWRMVHEEVLDDTEIRLGGHAPGGGSRGAGGAPAGAPGLEFQVDLAFQDPRPLNPLAMGDRSTSTTGRPAACPPRRWPPSSSTSGKVAQCRIFARDHRHDRELTEAFRRVLYDPAAGRADPWRSRGASRWPWWSRSSAGRLRLAPVVHVETSQRLGREDLIPDFQANRAAAGGPAEPSRVVEVRYRSAGGPVPAHRSAGPALPVHRRPAAGRTWSSSSSPTIPSRGARASRSSISNPGRRGRRRRWTSTPTTGCGSFARTSRSTRRCCGGCSRC